MIYKALPASIPFLLVDDRPENLLSLESLLENPEYQLFTASSGNEALLQTLKQDFALVLLDVQMPGMDGFETAELMRANPKTSNIPIIFVTAGMKELQFQFKGYDSGAVDYLAKPIEPVILQSKVRIFAELYRQRYQLRFNQELLELQVQERTEELKKTNEKLLRKNVEMEVVQDILRHKITEFEDTHNQLLATEEMLRVQIEEYETGQLLLKESNMTLQKVFDLSPISIVISSFSNGLIYEINNTFSENFGYKNDFAIGKTGDDLGLWLDIDDKVRFFKQMNSQNEVSHFNTVIKTFSGEKRFVDLYGTLMDYKNERCMLIVFLDVTEQKRMENQIRQTQKMEVIGQLAGGVAHDFNNMLTAIIGSAEMMERYLTEIPAANKLLGTIQQAANRSAELTGQLLAFSRNGYKNVVLLNIDKTIQDMISLLERTIDKNITLETRLLAKNCYVNGDPALLQNALLNLGVNARDAMHDGGVITYTTTNVNLDDGYCKSSTFKIAPGPYIEITVTDSGSGMTKDTIQHIFEPFFTTKEVGKGTGLGLAAVYGTITEHEGCINIYSQPGVGTVFKLYLPLSTDKQLDTDSIETDKSGSGGILLVDDEEILRDLGRSILEDFGYTVFTAEDGIQAVEIYERERDNISLVVLDMLMPRMGGKETLLKLLEINPDIRVLISSGFQQEGTVDNSIRLGACGFLRKPYPANELGRAVAKALEK
ncbi:MAG: response regulator [Desulfuromonadaceae bacterium]|nr:response regulator [Desulfuromonadaceae bacterium]MDD2855560.1 response regulator [Desulfuromonadaceae bacterium]